jgi:hypothetical protein
VLVERGELAEAQATLDAYGHDDASGAKGNLAGALADQLQARRLNGAGRGPDPDFDGWLRIARLLHATGNEHAAAREAEAALGWARVWSTPGHRGQALTISGLIRGGDEGLAHLHEAVAQLERSPARRELARSLVELGAALRRRRFGARNRRALTH